MLGKGKITIDSGAAESVTPKDMLVNEPVIEGQAKKNGVKHVAANGARMENQGEKRVRFKTSGSGMMNSITLQVTDVGKPLAAVSRILDKGNTVVFSRGAAGERQGRTSATIRLGRRPSSRRRRCKVLWHYMYIYVCVVHSLLFFVFLCVYIIAYIGRLYCHLFPCLVTCRHM